MNRLEAIFEVEQTLEHHKEDLEELLSRRTVPYYPKARLDNLRDRVDFYSIVLDDLKTVHAEEARKEEWKRYISYLHKWANENSGVEHFGIAPKSFDTWSDYLDDISEAMEGT